MPTWHDLPREIHDHVLQMFCLDIIELYKSVPIEGPRVYQDFSVFRNNWVDCPKSLKYFCSAMRTCRAFHNTITHIVRIDGMSPVDKLQALQRTKVEEINDAALNYHLGTWPIETCTNIAGVFWKNPRILEDVDLMSSTILMLPYDSCPILLPHLGEWISSHSRPCSDEDRVDELDVWESTIRGAGDELLLQLGSYTIPATLDEGQAIQSTSGLYKGFRNMQLIDEQEACSEIIDFDSFVPQTEEEYTLRQTELNKKFLDKFSVLRDIDSSKPDTWWLFAISEGDWYVVDYEGKRMWGSLCEPIMCYWDDVWELTSWKLGSEGRKFGPFWFGLGDDGESEEGSVASESDTNEDTPSLAS